MAQYLVQDIPDVILIQPKIYQDERGFFLEIYQKQKYRDKNVVADFVQDNHSGSKRGVLRGLHYQIHQPQGKLVSAVVGEIFDVVVDIRRHSPTFGRWLGATLSAEKKNQLWIPPGFAHGFYTLSDWAEVLYKATDYYAPQWEKTLLWDDPTVGIQWPLTNGEQPILSAKDLAGSLLADADVFE